MSRQVSLLAFLSGIISLCVPRCGAAFTIDAHQVHGINSFNNMNLVDFSESSNLFSSFPPIHEIGVFTPGASNASKIFKSTSLDTLVATIDAYDFQVALKFPRGIGPFNVPIAQVPTISVLSTSISDRLTPNSFASSTDPAVREGPYLSKEADGIISLGEWNSAVGQIRGRCVSGTAKVRILLKHALPNALYTAWDIGVANPLTKEEALSTSPFGGLPNVIVTDKNGRGSLFRTVNYCPFDKCKGAKRCTLYISLFYHFDHMVYAAAPALDLAGLAVGHVGSNQLQFFLNGNVISQPSKEF